MATTVHIPKSLLITVDKKAEEKGISRNKFIVQTLTKEVDKDWPEEIMKRLKAKSNKELEQGTDELMKIIKNNRMDKKNIKL